MSAGQKVPRVDETFCHIERIYVCTLLLWSARGCLMLARIRSLLVSIMEA